MNNGSKARTCRLWPLVLAFGLAVPTPALAYTPDSPEVKQLVERALRWLETQDDDRLGGKCLIGLSFFKAGRPLTHPKIRAALAACQAGPPTADLGDQHEKSNYNIGLAVIFLLETDPVKNRALAQRYVVEILRRQKPHGGWGYPSYETGDTSQIQYPILGLWLAINHNIDVPGISAALEKACGWLLRTQDPSGGWTYQGHDPGPGRPRVQQGEITPALTAAGLGSLYVCADALGLNDDAPALDEPALPSALKLVGEQKPRRRRYTGKAIDPQQVRRAMDDGNQWFAKNFTVRPPAYTHYYLYALERYQTFRELTERRSDPEPAWYNEVVKMLRETPQDNGSWDGEDKAEIATCFSVLTLLRSAQRTVAHRVADLGKGVLLGGMGLPPNVADLRERDGKLVETPLAGTLEELLAIVENPKHPDFDRLADSRQVLTLDSDVTKRSGQIARLRALVSAGEFQSRLVAVRALGRVRELDNVPLLLYALTDPDLRIVREADQGLRFISRKFDGVGLPAEPKPEEVKAGIAAWKAWYLSIRPNAELLD